MTAYKKHRATHPPYGRVLTREERDLLFFVAQKRAARKRQLEEIRRRGLKRAYK